MSNDDERLGLIETGCAYWFNDSEQVRSPFPKKIQSEVKRKASQEYKQWLGNLNEKDRQEVDDEELVGVFEALLFGEALKLIDKDDADLALTLYHPFMPRVGDVVNDEKRGPSRIVERRMEPTEDKKPSMIVILETVESKQTWQTEFMLPP